jgi:endonuclease-3 related protein
MDKPDRAIAQRLAAMYRQLRGHFDHAPAWWPGNPLEIALSAILVQQCGWHAAARAVDRLRQNGIDSPRRLAQADATRVRTWIGGVAFAPTKAPRLVRFAQALVQQGYDDLAAYLAAAPPSVRRRDLLALAGIGEETADCILLFAGEHPTFVIDAYTRRAFARLGLFAGRDADWWLKQPYGVLQAFLQDHVLADLALYDDFAFAPGVPRAVSLLRDWHAQLVELCKHHCLREPRCGQRGATGWPDYGFCEAHCLEAVCTACPLRNGCARGKAKGS